ncbi:MAG: hypothetical protein IJO88_04480 [Oscillospiraceae bacterium]|nr:hypothetical protein [Oscillospiraceae bacterium]
MFVGAGIARPYELLGKCLHALSVIACGDATSPKGGGKALALPLGSDATAACGG